MASGKKSGDGDGKDLWRTVTDSVTPLKSRPRSIRSIDSSNPQEPKPPPAPRAKRKPPAPATLLPPVQKPDVARAAPDLGVGKTAGVDRRTTERLRKGKLEIEARLDLHGHTQESAHRALFAFIDASFAAGRRCVLVVTGKGKGVLQSGVPRWLNEAPMRPKVLSIQYAQQRDGGTGALYVLLRRKR